MTMNNISTSGGLRTKFRNVVKTLNLNVSGAKRDVDPKQRPDRFSSIRELNHITTTFEHAKTYCYRRFLEI